MEHTKGPWKFNESNRIQGIFFIRDKDKMCLASTHNVSLENNDTEKANARLIAAAPELLEALETMQECLLESHQGEIDSGHFGDSEEEFCSYCKIITQANSIIKKAKGEE